MSFGRNVCKEEILRLPESSKTQKNLPEFHQQELATLHTDLPHKVKTYAYGLPKHLFDKAMLGE